MIGISVEDKGLGISRQHLHRLTERFYRTNVAQSRNSGGTGLGLAIVKHILNRHGGELQIESKEGIKINGISCHITVIEVQYKCYGEQLSFARARSEGGRA